jgi:hypothetical protein
MLRRAALRCFGVAMWRRFANRRPRHFADRSSRIRICTIPAMPQSVQAALRARRISVRVRRLVTAQRRISTQCEIIM